MKIITVIWAFFLVTISFAQPIEEEFSTALNEDGRTFLRFDAKNSFIANSQVKLWGVQLGYDHNNVVKYGLGFHNLSSTIKRDFYVKTGGITDTINSQLNFAYFSLFGEYVFYDTKHWEGSLPIQIGFGGTNFIGSLNDSTYRFHEKFVMHYEAALTGHYRFWRYFALGGGIGYRIMIIDNKNLNMQLTNPIYMIKFKFFLGDLFKDTKALFVNDD
jgi:hypothetical protein